MELQDILNHGEIQTELDRKMRDNWRRIPEDFKPQLDLSHPHGLQDNTQITLRGVNSGCQEAITLKELNFLYLYCFVNDFLLFRNYSFATPEQRRFYFFPDELKAFMRYSRLANLNELQAFVEAYRDELANYANITGRLQLYSILD